VPHENIVDVSAGTFVNVPRGVVHTYENIGNDVGKLLVIGIPEGFENFF
jgi:mannose-6-phosphate isomerase-like protein (cupin superfamily)